MKNPNWQGATAWQFTIVAKDLNSERPRTNPGSCLSGTRTGKRRIASPTRLPLGHVASSCLQYGQNSIVPFQRVWF